MFNYFLEMSPTWQALIATIFTWFMTLLGAALVFLCKKVDKKIMNCLLGFSAGVMIAASFWSLLNPAVEIAVELGMREWLVVSLGFLLGGLLIFVGDKIYSRIFKESNNCGNFRRSLMLISSITLHNIPEGLIVGVAFGSLAFMDVNSIWQAITLAIGIGIQNFPEGSAVSLPLKRDGYSCKKAFFYGQLSGIVEPIAAVIGSLLVTKVQMLLPFLLAFAAGAMIYVVISELLPESQNSSNKNFVSLVTILGFVLMMILDIALG